MKSFYQITATALVVAVLFSCLSKKQEKLQEKQEEKIIPATPIKKQIEVTLLGEIRTRRTFAGIQFIENEKEWGKYIAEQEKSNPTVDSRFTAMDSLLIHQFERLGLIERNEYLEKKFKPLTKQETNFIDSTGRVFPIKFFDDSLTGHTHFKIFFLGNSIEVDTKAISPQNLDYAFLDVIPGGNKELVFLDDYYIMNGFNFDFKVYEIKTY